MTETESMAVLVVEGGESDASIFTIDRGQCIVGKPPTADIPLGSPFISREHAEIRLTDGRHYLRDLGSKNGTWVNGAPVPPEGHPLANGDRVELARGQVTLRYLTGSSTITLPMVGSRGDEALQVDAGSREVNVAGVRIAPPLSRKEFDVLQLLYERSGQACSKDLIASRGWPERSGGDVGDPEIEQCIRRIRLRIEPDASNPMFVQTVRGFGYKLESSNG